MKTHSFDHYLNEEFQEQRRIQLKVKSEGLIKDILLDSDQQNTIFKWILQVLME